MQLQTNWEPRYARRAERMRASEIRELLKSKTAFAKD